MIPELTPEQLRWTCAPQTLDIQTTEHLSPLEGIIGQRRAAAALEFGLGIRDSGFNIYVAGSPGIGKMTAVRSFIEAQACDKPTPPDWCYVNNFEDPYQPNVYQLPAGRGRQLQQDLKSLIEHTRREIPSAFESDEYTNQREKILKAFEQQREEQLEQINKRAAKANFVLRAAATGILITPLLSEHELNEAEFEALPAPVRNDMLRRRAKLEEELKGVLKQIRELERGAQQQIQALDMQIALYIIGGLMDDLQEAYSDLPEIVAHLKAVQQDMLEHIELFRADATATAAASGEGQLSAPWLQELPFRKYQVNLLIDNSKQIGAPVIVEFSPSYPRLFGRIEKEAQFGALSTDFTMIKAGSFQQAYGGYLVIPVEDLLRDPFSWEGLKRTLRSHEVQIEELAERMGAVTTKSLRPQPIPAHVKIVLVGPPSLYYLLQAQDNEFTELFKVKADFDTTMVRDEQNIRAFLAFLSTLCQKEQLRHLDAEAATRLLEHSARLAEDQERLSTHFGTQADVIREANFWAAQEHAPQIGAAHVRKALEQQIYRSNLIQEHIQKLIAQGTLLIDTSGQQVGQVNGLAVIGLGDYSFGQPNRITASVAPGREGIIDIERESKLGGPIHSKGVLILSGYLAQTYAQNYPLSMEARLVFEQSYEGVEGDSASSAELYALLSALAQIPLKQTIAVTGSINQRGEIQAIGGVNQKIEGFFDVCQARGLNGEHGVIIPESNRRNLMLREDIVAAVQAGKFHIWTVRTVGEGIAILSGKPAGERDAEGAFAADSMNDRVDRRLREFAACLREFAATPSRRSDKPARR